MKAKKCWYKEAQITVHLTSYEQGASIVGAPRLFLPNRNSLCSERDIFSAEAIEWGFLRYKIDGCTEATYNSRTV